MGFKFRAPFYFGDIKMANTFFERIFGVPEAPIAYVDLHKFFSYNTEPFKHLFKVDGVGRYCNSHCKALNFIQRFILAIDNEISALEGSFEAISVNEPVYIEDKALRSDIESDYFDLVETVREDGYITFKEWFRMAVKVYLELDFNYWMDRAPTMLRNELLHQILIAHAKEVMKNAKSLTRCDQLTPDMNLEAFLQFFFENDLIELLKEIDAVGYIDLDEIDKMNLSPEAHKQVITKLHLTHPYVKGERRTWVMLPQSRFPVIDIIKSIEKGFKDVSLSE